LCIREEKVKTKKEEEEEEEVESSALYKPRKITNQPTTEPW